jgi:transcriptional regulator with XRE-family HTH domain
MSDGIGARLRAERERQGISIASIAASTKISASLFEGLEREDVSRWPQGIFRRAFVREYARAIGLDPEETLNDFLERFPDPLAAPASTEEDAAAAAERPRRPRTVLRLTLADMPGWQAGAPPSVGIGKRCAAVALDATAVVAVALALYVALGSFWMSLAVFTFCYYIGATLVLGNTPGVRFFAARVPAPRAPAPPAGDDSGERYFDGIGAIASVSDPLSSS